MLLSAHSRLPGNAFARQDRIRCQKRRRGVSFLRRARGPPHRGRTIPHRQSGQPTRCPSRRVGQNRDHNETAPPRVLQCARRRLRKNISAYKTTLAPIHPERQPNNLKHRENFPVPRKTKPGSPIRKPSRRSPAPGRLPARQPSRRTKIARSV